MNELHPMTVIAGLSLALSLGVAAWCLRRARDNRAARAFAWVALAQSWWNLGHAIESSSSTLHAKLVWDTLQIPATIGVGLATLAFTAEYVGSRRARRAVRIGAVAATGPAVLGVMAPLLGWSRRDARLEGDPPVLVYSFELLDLLGALVFWVASLASVGWLVRHLAREHARYVVPTAVVTAAIAVTPVGTLIAAAIGVTVLGDRDVSAVLFAVESGLVIWALRHTRLFELAPAGRDAVFEGLADPVVVADLHGRIVELNPATARLLGRPTDALFGRPCDEVLAAWPDVHRPGDGVIAIDLTDFPGAPGRWFDVTRTEIRDRGVGAVVGVTLTFHDVTERHQGRVALEARVEDGATALDRAEGRFRAIFDGSFQLMGLLDLDGRVLEANRAACALAGVEPEAVRGRLFWETPWWTHDPAQAARLREAIARGARGEFVRFESTHPGPDGAVHTIDFSLTPVRDAAGAVIQLLPEGRDLTALRAAEQRSAALAAQLVQAQKLESLGRLAGGVAHDFNNLLAVILANAELARQATPPRGEAMEWLDAIVEAASSGASVTHQLLAFSRQQPRGGGAARLPEMMTPLGRLLGRLLGEDVRLELDVAPGLWPVALDATQVTQVIMNLAVNARDAMPAGGTLRIVADNVDADAAAPGALAAGPRVRIRVADTGAGMTPEVRARVFEPFFTTKPEGVGTGLGLAVVHGLVTGAGGTIGIDSAPGQGTEVTLWLPRAEPAAAASPAAAPAPVASARTARVLVVEDHAPLRRIVDRVLRARGLPVDVFADADAALAAAATLPAPDLLLTDIVLPGTDGLALATALAARWPALRVVFMSGYAPERHRVQLSTLGPTEYLEKPFTVDQLAARVDEALATGQPWARHTPAS